MKAIDTNVFIEDQFAGAVLGVIATPRGLIQIDAPPAPEDARAWRASLMNVPGGIERVLINLDAHPDRTIGARAMDCTVIAQEKTAQVFRTRPNTFKAQGDETGSDWEAIAGIGSVRWAPPEIAFGERLMLHWNGSPVVLEHRPGPAGGAIWVVLPEQRILFVGDAVLKNQPPFFAGANLARWIDNVHRLLGPDYKDFQIVSSRGGVVGAPVVKGQLEFLKYARERLEKLAERRAHPDQTEKLIEPLLKKLKFPASRHKQFAQRLRHGLHQYYSRRYHHAGRRSDED
jgi:glyoxylase-like metal-dependent hydrolase (beta-lactamase superfamily II)